ncbi:MAG: hypothetical protein WDO13_15090 [Verrucomicrobiota bacterium]
MNIELREILAELDVRDPEHPDTWLTHENGWTLSVYATGLIIWSKSNSPGESRHQIHVSREKAVEALV